MAQLLSDPFGSADSRRLNLRTYQSRIAARPRKKFGRYWDAMHLQAEIGKLHLAVFGVLRTLGGQARRLTPAEAEKLAGAVLRCLNETLWLAEEWKVEVPGLELSFPAWRKAVTPGGGSLGRRAGLILSELVLDAATLLRVESRARVERSRVELSPHKLQAILRNLGSLAGLLGVVPEDEIGKGAAKVRKSASGPGMVKRRSGALDHAGLRTDETLPALTPGAPAAPFGAVIPAKITGYWLSQPAHPTLDENLVEAV